MGDWTLQDAKNRFSALVNAALTGEPQRVTRRGQPAVVVVAVEEYERLCQAEKVGAPPFEEQNGAPDFIQHLLAIPKGGPDDLFERIPIQMREVDFDVSDGY